jgi:Domain of unknown function (DUF4349)/Putative zinc-finger
MSEHAWVQENIASYVAGGLEPAERERLEQHISECQSCASALQEARGLDQTLQSLFTPVRPTPGLEDRMIRGLRKVARLSFPKRALAAAAAVFVIGAVGAGTVALIGRSQMPFPGALAFSRGSSTHVSDSSFSVRDDHASASHNALAGASYPMIPSQDGVDELARNTRERAMQPLSVHGVETEFSKILTPVQETQTGSLLFGVGAEQNVNTKAQGGPGGGFSGGAGSTGIPPFSDGTSNTILFSEKLGDAHWVQGKQSSGVSGGAGGAVALGDVTKTFTKGTSSTIHFDEPYKAAVSPIDGKDAGALGYYPPAPALVVKGKSSVYSYRNDAPAHTTLGPGLSEPVLNKDPKQANLGAANDEKREALDRAASKGKYFKPGDLEPQARADAQAQKKTPVPATQAGQAVTDDLESQAGANAQGRKAPARVGQMIISGKEPAQANTVPRQSPAKPTPPETPPASPAPRKIVIRSGDIEFEVQSFDSAVAAVTRLVNDTKGGFVATVNSEKLPNGKVRGSVAVRVPPEHLDSFVLDLRKELGKQGELKGLRIGSQDITKQYTDLESRLRAARAMEERLLQIIKSGQGQIKDLLAAEKELGVWRTRIEEFEGELRYYQNLVSLSTLTITLYEKEIRSPYAILQTERVQMGFEVEDVEKAHRAALAAVAEAKGRVTKSEMRQHAAGQFSAVLNFEVAPDAGGPLRDRLKQLGTLARLDVDRLQQEEGGTGRPGDAKIKERDTVFLVSFYNLANVAPRETVHLNLATPDAEAAYKTILARAEKSAGRVVSSSLNHQRNDQTRGEIQFEIKAADAEAVLLDLKNVGEVMRLQVTENADTQNVTKSKRGFNVQIWALAAVAPRETSTIQLATKDVPAGYRKLQETVTQAKGRVLNSQLNEQDKQNVTAQLDFEVPRADEAAVTATMSGIGDIYSRNVVRAQDGDTVVDSKVRLQVSLINVARIPPRETTVLGIEVADVDQTVSVFSALVGDKQGRAVESHVARERTGRVTAKLVYDVPLSAAPELIDKFKGAGTLRVHQSSRNQQVPDSNLATARLDVTLSNVELIVPSDDGLWPQVRRGLSWSFTALAWSLSWIIVGLCVVLPWALVLYGLYRLILRFRRRPDVVSS